MAVVIVVDCWFPCLQILGKRKVHNTAQTASNCASRLRDHAGF